MNKPAAVVLLSGGMDSATTAAIASSQGFELHALSFRYGQRHAAELKAAERVARSLSITRHVILDIDLRAIGGSALTSDLAVPKDTPLETIGERIPATYVPARNTIFLSFALALAETVGASDIFIGANALDYSGYPDCRPEYFRAFQAMADLATRGGVEGGRRVTIHTPLIELSKHQIIERGMALGVDFGLTLTCYDPAEDGAACGRCEACQLRLNGFREIGIEDPVVYQAVSGTRTSVSGTRTSVSGTRTSVSGEERT
jgi:7-cyano-7-deazaguanine synthase